jgi:hypothetical protein
MPPRLVGTCRKPNMDGQPPRRQSLQFGALRSSAQLQRRSIRCEDGVRPFGRTLLCFRTSSAKKHSPVAARAGVAERSMVRHPQPLLTSPPRPSAASRIPSAVEGLVSALASAPVVVPTLATPPAPGPPPTSAVDPACGGFRHRAGPRRRDRLHPAHNPVVASEEYGARTARLRVIVDSIAAPRRTVKHVIVHLERLHRFLQTDRYVRARAGAVPCERYRNAKISVGYVERLRKGLGGDPILCVAQTSALP